MKDFNALGGSGGGGFDWNGNDKRDAFDSYMDMKVSGCDNYSDNVEEENSIESNLSSSNSQPNSPNNNKKLKGITLGGKPLYDASKDSNGVTILKCLLVTVLCIGGIALPIATDMGILGTLLSVFGGLGLSVLILKNV